MKGPVFWVVSGNADCDFVSGSFFELQPTKNNNKKNNKNLFITICAPVMNVITYIVY